MNRRRRRPTGARKIRAKNRAWNLTVNKKRRKVSRTHFVVNDRIHITDPCYESGSAAGFFDVEAKPGHWVGRVHRKDEGEWGVRISALVIHHVDHAGETRNQWERLGRIAVDSGQAGVFASDAYRHKPDDDPTNPSTFYGSACALTLAKPNHGAFRAGYVSQSGFGDGVYPVRVVKRRGRIVAVRIDFL